MVYKAFDYNSLKKVTAQIHFLKPMYYEEYKDMSTKEIAECVKARIREKMEKVLSKENEK